MTTFRPAGGRGTTALGWLDSKHSFSFGEYHDPRRRAVPQFARAER